MAAVECHAVDTRNMELDKEEVDIREEAGRIVIEPVRKKKYKQDDLLKGITKDNLHKEIDFGGPEGNEVW
jgi:antitoxin MazE